MSFTGRFEDKTYVRVPKIWRLKINSQLKFRKTQKAANNRLGKSRFYKETTCNN